MALYLILVFSLVSIFHMSHGEQPVVEEIIVPRKAHLLGGWNEVNPQRRDVNEAAQKAVEKFNAKSKSKYYFQLLNITSAHSQVTNRINFNIEATFVKTECLKSEPTDLGSCALGEKLLTCKSEVHFDPRIMEFIAKRVSCKK